MINKSLLLNKEIVYSINQINTLIFHIKNVLNTIPDSSLRKTMALGAIIYQPDTIWGLKANIEALVL